MSKKKKKQREEKKGEINEYRWEDIKEEPKEVKRETKKDEEVILMGAPRKGTKELPRFEKKETKPSAPLKKDTKKDVKKDAKSVKIDFGDDVEHTTASEEELKKITNTKKNVPGPKGHSSLGKIFFGFILLFVGYLIIGQVFNMFGPTSVSLLALWPLLIIFIGLSLFKVKKRGLTRIMAWLLVFVVFVASISLVFKGGDIVKIQTADIVATEERGIDPFSEINFDGVGTIKITKGDREAVIVSGDEAILGEVSTVIEDDVLTIKYDNLLWSLFLFEETSIDVEVITRDVSKVVISGKADVDVSGASGGALDVTVNGEGNVTIQNVFLNDLVVRINGKGEVVASGDANRVYVFLSGVGSYDGMSLNSSETGVRISGVGDVKVNTKDELNVSISGVGNVIYSGEPALTGGKITGVGSVMSKAEAEAEAVDNSEAESTKVDSGKEPVEEVPELVGEEKVEVEVEEEEIEVDDSEIVEDPEDFLKSLNSVL